MGWTSVYQGYHLQPTHSCIQKIEVIPSFALQIMFLISSRELAQTCYQDTQNIQLRLWSLLNLDSFQGFQLFLQKTTYVKMILVTKETSNVLTSTLRPSLLLLCWDVSTILGILHSTEQSQLRLCYPPFCTRIWHVIFITCPIGFQGGMVILAFQGFEFF